MNRATEASLEGETIIPTEEQTLDLDAKLAELQAAEQAIRDAGITGIPQLRALAIAGIAVRDMQKLIVECQANLDAGKTPIAVRMTDVGTYRFTWSE